MPFFVTALMLVVSSSVFGIAYDQEIFPFYQSMSHGTLTTKDNVTLDYRTSVQANERGAIVFVTGYTQSHVQYAELLHDFSKLGYSVYIMDHRGHGFSSRLLSNPKIVHVGNFFDYTKDLKQFVDTVVKPKTHKALFMLGHSMGGLISLMYQMRYPNDFHAVAVNSPLVEIIANGIPELAAYEMANGAVLIGKGKDYAIGQHDPDVSKITFENQTRTHSNERYDIKIKIWNRFPETLMGGSSYGWVARAVQASRWMRFNAPKAVKLPVLMLVSEVDTVVVSRTSKSLCGRMSDCELVPQAGAYHETLWEDDAIRGPAVAKISAFFEKHR